MQHGDRDIEEAFDQRERVIDSHLALEKHNSLEPWRIPAIRSMRSAPIVVWEQSALHEFVRFWEDTSNFRVFRERCLTTDGYRYVRALLEPAFHFFPAGGPHAPLDYVPPEAKDPLLTSIFIPDIKSISIGPLQVNRFVP